MIPTGSNNARITYFVRSYQPFSHARILLFSHSHMLGPSYLHRTYLTKLSHSRCDSNVQIGLIQQAIITAHQLTTIASLESSNQSYSCSDLLFPTGYRPKMLA